MRGSGATGTAYSGATGVYPGTVISNQSFEEADYGDDDGNNIDNNNDNTGGSNPPTFAHFRRTRVRPQTSMASWGYGADNDIDDDNGGFYEYDDDYDDEDVGCGKCRCLLRTSHLVLLTFLVITLLVVVFLSCVFVYVPNGVIVRNVKNVLGYVVAGATLLIPDEVYRV